VLYGVVVSSSPEAKPSGWLRLTRGSEQLGMASVERSPSYAFAGLAPGKYTLKGQAQDHLPYEAEVEVAGPTRHDVKLGKAWNLVVKAVTADGRPLREALQQEARFSWDRALRAIASRTRPAGDFPLTSLATLEGGVGTYRGASGFEAMGSKPMSKDAIGLLALPADGPAFVSLVLRSAVLATKDASPGQEELTFVLEPADVTAKSGTVRLRLVDGGGKPLEGVHVALNDDQTGAGGKPTDADGRVTLANLAPGYLRLEAMAKGLSIPPLQVAVTAGASIDLGDVTMLPPDQVSIDAGDDKEGSLWLTWLEAVPWPDSRVKTLSSSPRGGSFEWPLYPGRYWIRVRGKSTYGEREFDTKAVAGQTVKVTLAPGAPLTFVAKSGDRHGIILRDARGRAVFDRTLSGTYEFTWPFAAGDYTAEITDPAGKVAKKAVKLAALGATLTIP